jgi:hypothetical protein
VPRSAATAESNAALDRLTPLWIPPGSAKPGIRQERARECRPRRVELARLKPRVVRNRLPVHSGLDKALPHL